MFLYPCIKVQIHLVHYIMHSKLLLNRVERKGEGAISLRIIILHDGLKVTSATSILLVWFISQNINTCIVFQLLSARCSIKSVHGLNLQQCQSMHPQFSRCLSELRHISSSEISPLLSSVPSSS